MPLTFLPWLRDGLSGNIAIQEAAPPPGMKVTNRATLALSLDLNGAAVPVTNVRLLGPSDVVGIDERHIVRRDPPPFYTEHETTHFPSIEFDSPSLPWAFTPAAADDTQRLRPWLTLVVVRAQDGVTLTPDPHRGISILRIGPPAIPAAELPDPNTTWAGAHAQIAGEVTASTLEHVLGALPERTLSRLICLRALDPGKRYFACVVPTFAGGRDVALGVDPAPGSSFPKGAAPDESIQAAWSIQDPQVMLPAYQSWEFVTAEFAGDFLNLAQKLRGEICPPTVGQIRLDIATPGFPWPALPGNTPPAPLIAFGALRGRAATANGPPPGPTPEVRSGLAAVLRNDGTGKELRIPTYGGAYAATSSVGITDTGWLAELNLDPRYRFAAALGAQVVREQSEHLVAAVEEQVGKTREVNELLSRGQLARTAGETMHAKHLAPLPAAVLLQVTQPVHDRVRMSPTTLGTVLADGPLADAFVSPTFRKLTRPTGNLVKAATRSALNRANWTAGIVGTPGMAPQPAESQAQPHAVADALIAPSNTSPAMQVLAATGVLSTAVSKAPTADSPPPTRRGAIGPFDATAHGIVLDSGRVSDSQSGLPPERLSAILLDRLNPEYTIPDRILPRTTIPPRPSREILADPLGSQLVAPSFQTPMYSALAKSAPQFVIPGADALPPNTVTLLEPSPEFIASFLIGLNTQLGQELVWRGLPVDRRTTFFQRFWDFRGTGSYRSVDIQSLDSWPIGSSLRDAVDSSLPVMVLAIRGDLLRRYPRTAVYAVVAGPDGLPDETKSENTVNPAFVGFQDPDIRFFGFNLDPNLATGRSGGNGYLIILQEQATETRFGTPLGGLPLSGTAADVAIAALRNPVRVVIRAKDLLPPGT